MRKLLVILFLMTSSLVFAQGKKLTIQISGISGTSSMDIDLTPYLKIDSAVGIFQPTITGTGLVKSASGTISYITDYSSDWNTAFGWGNHASAGYLLSSTAASTYQPIGSYLVVADLAPYLTSSTAASTYQPIGSYLTSITSGDVTTALGYTPYNATNPNGYITSVTAASTYSLIGHTHALSDLTSYTTTSDIEITDYTKGIILKTLDGTRARITLVKDVDNILTLQITAL